MFNKTIVSGKKFQGHVISGLSPVGMTKDFERFKPGTHRPVAGMRLVSSN